LPRVKPSELWEDIPPDDAASEGGVHRSGERRERRAKVVEGRLLGRRLTTGGCCQPRRRHSAVCPCHGTACMSCIGDRYASPCQRRASVWHRRYALNHGTDYISCALRRRNEGIACSGLGLCAREDLTLAVLVNNAYAPGGHKGCVRPETPRIMRRYLEPVKSRRPGLCD